MGVVMKMSICIPTWEQHGYGRRYLKEMFDSIVTQTFKDFNVVISDQSDNEGIKDLVSDYSSLFKIIYLKNQNNRGNGPANTNNTLKHADGDIIKIMFQDDLFVDNKALQLIHDTFIETNCNWLVNGCNHTKDGKTFYREMVPSWNDKILEGVNTISSPSVLSIKNVDKLYFDEELVMMMDCEYYYQLYQKYGLPTIIKKPLISNRTHKHQISSMYTKNIKQEINYVKNKHYVNL